MTDTIPKAELHCHLEGTAPPALVRRLAERNGIALPDGLFADEHNFAWTDFPDFLRAYDAASMCLRKAADYRDITYEYLAACAREGAIYVEMFTSPDHAAEVGMSYLDHLEGTVAGIEDADRDFGIVGRIIVTCVRHLGPDRGLTVAKDMVGEPHPYVVGFGMGGDETAFHLRDFLPVFRIAADAGLGCTVHAGEVCGPESIYAARDSLPVTRRGHGGRAVEDPRRVERPSARRRGYASALTTSTGSAISRTARCLAAAPPQLSTPVFSTGISTGVKRTMTMMTTMTETRWGDGDSAANETD